MLVTHNYFWPTINGHVYYDKPLGSYWLVIFSTPLTGGLNEAATRLPCAIAGLLAVALLMLLVRRLYDARTAITRRRHPRDQLQLRILFAPRQRRRRNAHRRAGRTAALQSQRRSRRRIVGRRPVADHGGDFAHQRSARIRAAAIGDWSVFMPARRGGPFFKAISRGSLVDRIRRLIERNRWFFNWYTVVAIALGGLVYYLPFQISSRLMGSQKGLADGISRERGAVFPPVRPSRSHLLICLRHLRPDGSVVSAVARVSGRNARPPPGRRRACSRGSIRVGLFLGDVHIFHASRDRAAATTSCRFCPPRRSWSPERSRIQANYAR